jgi:hypothetical protein
MPGRPEAAPATVLLAICVAAGALLISGCGGGGATTGAGGTTGAGVPTEASTVAAEPQTKVAQPLAPYVTLSRCESLYERVYANTARKVRELGTLGSEATPAQRRELAAARTKHGQALEFCEEEIELNQVHGRREINIAATCGQSKSAVEELRSELAAGRREEFNQRRPIVCARIAGGEGGQ